MKHRNCTGKKCQVFLQNMIEVVTNKKGNALAFPFLCVMGNCVKCSGISVKFFCLVCKVLDNLGQNVC